MVKEFFKAPTNLSKPSAIEQKQPSRFDFYVGGEHGDYPTIEAARDAVRAKRASGHTGKLTVAVRGGEYKVNGLIFGEQDSDTEYYAQGEAVLNGGVTVPSTLFEPVSGDMALRLDESARGKIYCADLCKLGITSEDYGKIYAVGSFNTANKYDGDTIGVTCEVFCNDRRMVMARYPNGNNFMRIQAVMDNGDVGELPEQNYFEGFADIRNPRGGKVIMSREDGKRCDKWKTVKDVWALGYFYHDWAESSTPVKSLDCAHRMVEFGYASSYAYRVGAPFYFYNVFEELDEPGEYYLDRETGVLYVYPYLGEGQTIADVKIEMSLSRSEIIRAENVSGMVFDGFTLKCTRADAVRISGDGNTVRNCFITNVFGNAIIALGSDNTVERCEITHTGRGGIILHGGDRTTLTPGNSRAVNNFIHDWSEVYLAYQPAVSLNGVGNLCAHNEICNSPQMAINYSGNDNIIEYNLIHDVVKQSSDAGAIYSGRSWSDYGNVMRFNCLYNIGAGDFHPCGIYWDDALSGQSAYGNIIVNVGDHGFLIGGGRDNFIGGNIVVNAGGCGISFDDRARDGLVNEGWARQGYNTLESQSWQSLLTMPYKEGVWAEKYPTLKTLRCDFDDLDDPDFPANPTNSIVSGNIVVDKNGALGNIAKSVCKYGDVGVNAVFGFDDDAGFTDIDGGDYTFKPDAAALKVLPDFEPIPFDKIGRE